jgi:hypothetical protein
MRHGSWTQEGTLEPLRGGHSVWARCLQEVTKREYELKCAQYTKGLRAGMCSIYQGSTS